MVWRSAVNTAAARSGDSAARSASAMATSCPAVRSAIGSAAASLFVTLRSMRAATSTGRAALTALLAIALSRGRIDRVDFGHAGDRLVGNFVGFSSQNVRSRLVGDDASCFALEGLDGFHRQLGPVRLARQDGRRALDQRVRWRWRRRRWDIASLRQTARHAGRRAAGRTVGAGHRRAADAAVNCRRDRPTRRGMRRIGRSEAVAACRVQRGSTCGPALSDWDRPSSVRHARHLSRAAPAGRAAAPRETSLTSRTAHRGRVAGRLRSWAFR